MDNLKKAAETIIAGHSIIEAELAEVESSGSFKYARSKNIRKAAMDIMKACKELRVSALAEYKSQKNNQ